MPSASIAAIGLLGGGLLGALTGHPAAPPPPPPPPNPATLASNSVQQSGDQARLAAQAAAGQGYSDTLETGPEGAPAPATTGKSLLGS